MWLSLVKCDVCQLQPQGLLLNRHYRPVVMSPTCFRCGWHSSYAIANEFKPCTVKETAHNEMNVILSQFCATALHRSYCPDQHFSIVFYVLVHVEAAKVFVESGCSVKLGLTGCCFGTCWTGVPCAFSPPGVSLLPCGIRQQLCIGASYWRCCAVAVLPTHMRSLGLWEGLWHSWVLQTPWTTETLTSHTNLHVVISSKGSGFDYTFSGHTGQGFGSQ